MADHLKFIHASDLHLDQPIEGLTELPPHLRTIFANAPYDAAARIFDLAIAERVDFVLLAGDLFDVESGSARAHAFLLSQFQRLNEKNISIYWCGGETDFPDRWPSSVELPSNVLVFSSSIVERIEHRREGVSLCTIFASGYDPEHKNISEFSALENEGFNIGLTHGEIDTGVLSGKNVHYWALGGRHKSSKFEKTGTLAVFPGSPQGRSQKDPGPRGFRLCRVDANRKLRVQSIESDTVRWLPQTIAISENVSLKALKEMLTERALKVIADCPEQTVLCRWYLTTEGDFNPRIRKLEWAAEILEWLRDEFGRGDQGLWSTEVAVEAPRNLPGEWYEEDTILGEYMRAVARYQSDDSLKLNLHQYMPQAVAGASLADVGYVAKENRDSVLRQAGMVGIEYLAAHKEIAETDGNEIDLSSIE